MKSAMRVLHTIGEDGTNCVGGCGFTFGEDLEQGMRFLVEYPMGPPDDEGMWEYGFVPPGRSVPADAFECVGGWGGL